MQRKDSTLLSKIDLVDKIKGQSINLNLLTISSSAKDISAKINLLQAIQFVADSWRSINTNTLRNCFAASVNV